MLMRANVNYEISEFIKCKLFKKESNPKKKKKSLPAEEICNSFTFLRVIEPDTINFLGNIAV